MSRYLSAIFTLAILFFALPANAFSVPPYQGIPVVDNADIFSPEEETFLLEQIDLIERDTSVEVAVVTTPTLAGYPIESASLDIGREWGVGKSDVNNGLVILIAVDDREWFISTGYGLEGVLPDVAIKRIGENNFSSNFREGNYANGVKGALVNIEMLIKGDSSVVSELTKESQVGLTEVLFLIFGFAASIIFFMVLPFYLVIKIFFAAVSKTNNSNVPSAAEEFFYGHKKYGAGKANRVRSTSFRSRRRSRSGGGRFGGGGAGGRW